MTPDVWEIVPSQAIFLHQLGFLQFNSHTTWNYSQTPQGKDSVPHQTAPPHRLQTGCLTWASEPPVISQSFFLLLPLRFDNLLQQLTELRKTVHLVDYQFIIKFRRSPMEKMHKARCGGGTECPCPLQVSTLPAPTRKLSEPHTSGIFIEASLCTHD